MADKKTTIDELRRLVRKFRDARGWSVDGNIKNKAISMVLEAVELLEHFQWRETEEVVGHSERKEEVVDELADVLYWVLALADHLKVDLSVALKNKINKAEKKYPAKAFPKKYSKKSLEKYYELRNKERKARGKRLKQ